MTLEDLDRACGVLAGLVRAEYPPGLSLAEIAWRWGEGDIDEAAIAALERLEDRYPNLAAASSTSSVR